MRNRIIYIVGVIIVLIIIGMAVILNNVDDETQGMQEGNSDTTQSHAPEVLSPDPICASDATYYVDKSGESLSQLDAIKNDINSNRCYLKDFGDGYYSSFFQSNGEYVFGFVRSENGDLQNNISLISSEDETVLPDKESEISDKDALLLFKTDSEDFKIMVGSKDITNIRSTDFE